MSFKRYFLGFLLILAFLGSCKRASKENESKTVFRYNDYDGISSLDPAYARSQANLWAVNQLFNGLVQMDDRLIVQPCIAKSWDISDDGKMYTFHLRSDIAFHNNEVFAPGKGRRVVASDFVYSFKRLLDPVVASPGSWVFNDVNDLADVNAPGFVAKDDSTLVINLKNIFPPFIGLLTTQYCSVIPHEGIEKYGKDFREHPIGTGPFMFKLWKEGVKMIFLKNPNYFEMEEGKRLPFMDAVSISFLNDKQAEFMEFIQGKLDFFKSLEASYKDELITKEGQLQPKYKGKFKMETLPYLNTEYLGFLIDDTLEVVKNSPLRLKAVRKAINYGFDRVKMITYLRNNIGTPGSSGFIPAGLPSFNADSVKGYYYDPAKAKKLLEEAGFPDGKGLPVITLSTTSTYLDLCEFIQSQLAELGIRTKIEVNQNATHREMVAKQKLNFFRGSWIADYPDAENYFSLFYSKNFAPAGPNNTHFSNSRFDELYEKSRMETDTTLRYKYYREMDRLIIEEAPVVVLYYDKVLRLYQNNLSGISGNAMNLLTLKRVRKIGQ